MKVIIFDKKDERRVRALHPFMVTSQTDSAIFSQSLLNPNLCVCLWMEGSFM